MALIFLASTELFSFESTGQFLRPFLRWLLPDASDATLTLIQVAIRKTAHMTEYGILAAFVFSAWRRSSGKAPWSWDRRHALGTWSLCVAYAALDELHQASVPSRTGSVTDVGWDALGAALLIGVLWLARRRSGAAPVTKGLPETA
jgi:VanZ family protein